FNVERLGNSARSLALGRYAYERAREHALTREQFGRPLCEFQGLQWKFAEMAIKLDAAQLLLYRAAVNADRGLPSAYQTSGGKVAGYPGGLQARQRSGAGGGRAGLFERDAGQILHGARPRLDDRGRLDRDAKESHRGACIRPPLRPAPAACQATGGGVRCLWVM